MKLNADLSQRALVYSEEIPWLDSPSPGVQRRMLDRDGAEIARATSIVRYATSSSFASHVHGGGEEFLVLAGVFSDEYGNYEPGTYVRNPVGSSHSPFSQSGCTIFVKLWQMHPDDQQRVVIHTAQNPWLPGEIEGIQVMPLHTYGTEKVSLMKWQPQTYALSHQNLRGEEILVLEGVLEDKFGYYPQGTWLRNPPGSIQTPFSREGCLLYVKEGHLV